MVRYNKPYTVRTVHTVMVRYNKTVHRSVLYIPLWYGITKPCTVPYCIYSYGTVYQTVHRTVLYIPLWYGITNRAPYRTVYTVMIRYNKPCTVPYHNCIYNRLPADEPSCLNHVEDIKMKG
jgi:hypothetical protein